MDATAAASPPSATGASADRADPRSSPLAVGVIVWLASEVMFFGGLFAAWFVLKAHNEPNWPPAGQEIDAVRMAVFTAVLIASSVTMHFVVEHAERNHRVAALRWLALTMVLGTVFLVHEAFEWYELPFRFDTSAFSSIFFLLTGFHGLHVLGGLVLMGIVGWVVFPPGSKAPLGQSMRVVSYYWHFVDVVWVVLYLTVYVLQ